MISLVEILFLNKNATPISFLSNHLDVLTSLKKKKKRAGLFPLSPPVVMLAYLCEVNLLKTLIKSAEV